MCISPITLKRNRDEWKEGIAHSTTRKVPCGKCPICIKRKVNNWVFRLTEEIKTSETSFFLTLTYDDLQLPLDYNGNPTLQKTDFQKFMKRLRKHVKNDETKNRRVLRQNGEITPEYTKLKYYMCGEYGSKTQRPHYHMIILNLPLKYVQREALINSIWQHGHVDRAECNIKTIRYVVGYINKGSIVPSNELDDRQKEFSLMSKGMGAKYLTPQKKNTIVKI